MRYFLDTYAIIEIINGNPNYQKYITSESFTSIFNLYELYFCLLKTNGEIFAKKIFNTFKNKILPLNDEHIFEASKFKLINIKKNLSYSDCLGYAMSKAYNVVFLTGDKEFENFENVEFVKK